MPWVKKVKAPHECNLPMSGGKQVGSIWKCWRCKKHWKMVTKGWSGGDIVTNWESIDHG